MEYKKWILQFETRHPFSERRNTGRGSFLNCWLWWPRSVSKNQIMLRRRVCADGMFPRMASAFLSRPKIGRQGSDCMTCAFEVRQLVFLFDKAFVACVSSGSRHRPHLHVAAVATLISLRARGLWLERYPMCCRFPTPLVSFAHQES